MKKVFALVLALVMMLALVPAAFAADYSGYTIRIYSNSNSTERVNWLVEEAKKAGFTISLDTNEVYSGDSAAVQAANENKDGDLIFGLNETRWGQLINGQYENLKIMDWTPTWADEVGEYKYDGKAYGIVIQNVLMLYRNDDLGTNGAELHFDHWADVVNCGYSWYRQNKVGGTTNANINSAMLYAFTDPTSPAGGISVDGWKTLWKFCADGKFGGDDWKYGIDPLIRGDVAVTEYYSSSLYGSIDTAADVNPDKPLKGTYEPENWALVDIKDGTYYIYYLKEGGDSYNHSIYLATTKDFVTYTEKDDVVLEASRAGGQDGWIGTGSVVKVKDTYYFFYTGHAFSDSYEFKEKILVAKGSSLTSFEKVADWEIAPPSELGQKNDFRDPQAYYDEATDTITLTDMAIGDRYRRSEQQGPDFEVHPVRGSYHNYL